MTSRPLDRPRATTYGQRACLRIDGERGLLLTVACVRTDDVGGPRGLRNLRPICPVCVFDELPRHDIQRDELFATVAGAVVRTVRRWRVCVQDAGRRGCGDGGRKMVCDRWAASGVSSRYRGGSNLSIDTRGRHEGQ